MVPKTVEDSQRRLRLAINKWLTLLTFADHVSVDELYMSCVTESKLDEHNRTWNVKKQSHIWEWNTQMLKLIEQNDSKMNIASILIQTSNDFGPTAGTSG